MRQALVGVGALIFFSEEASAGKAGQGGGGGTEKMAWILQRGPACQAFVTWQTEFDAV